jgi:hypothetical protein
MTHLLALALATPIYGLALTPPTIDPALDLAVPAHVVAQFDDVDEELAAGEEGEGDFFEEESAQADDAGEGLAEENAEQDSYAAQMKERNSLIKLHKPLGIATWGAMTVTTVLGFIQYYNLYGFFDDQGSNPCVTGDAIFGQETCSGTPWPHALAAGLTTGLYTATFTVSLMMPDPDDLASGKGEFADTLRLHKLLRWVHFGGMIAQAVIGIVIANDLGLDRANDYDTLQTLATLHMASGLVTYGALTWAGAIMTF